MLSPADLALHAKLGITPEWLERMQVTRVTDQEARTRLAITRTGCLDGLLYPYLDPVHQHIVTHRLRRDHPEQEHGKPKDKYISGFGDHRHLYFACEHADALTDATVPVLVVESEKSVLAVMSAAERMNRHVLAVGLGGCWGWKGRIGKTESVNGGRVDEDGPLPDFNRLRWVGRDVVLVFDSNARTNKSVQAARRALGQELARRGATVRVLDLAPEDGINGPDDYLGRHGHEPFFAALDQAADAAAVDVIVRLNQRHAVVRESGKVIVTTEDVDPVLHRRKLTRSSFNDFRNLYLNERIQVGMQKKTGEPIWQSAGDVWLRHPQRRQYDGIIMAPNGDVPGYLNLWSGFAVTATPGTCDRFKYHLYEVICHGNTALYDYVWAWLATGVQHPDRQAEVALALRGPRGAGKGVFARTYGELFGQHFLHIANTKHLTGHFNAHLQDAIVLFADEAFWAGDKQGEGVLKMLITEPVIPIERKGHDVVLAKNLLHIILASNHEWVVPAGLDERRFCVIDVDAGHQQDHPYFAELIAEIEHGGRAALLHELLHEPLGDFELRLVPQTDALREQKVLSLQANERWLFDRLMAGRWLPDHEEWQQEIPKDDVHADYIQTLQRVGVDRRSTETELGMFLARLLGDKVCPQRKMLQGKRRWVWQFSSLSDCRAAFDEATHSQHPWPMGEEVWR